jgi:hypothetical protein
LYCSDNPVNRIDPSGHEGELASTLTSLYVSAQLATFNFVTANGIAAETSALITAFSIYQSAQLLSTGVDPDTGETATAAAAAFAIVDFLPAGQFITKPLNLAAKASFREGAKLIWDSLSPIKRIDAEVHHRIPLEWSHIFSNLSPNRIENLQLIKTATHRGVDGVTSAWRQFKAQLGGHPPTAEQVEAMAKTIDKNFAEDIKTLDIK